MDEKLTVREIPLLTEEFNLTDGHAYRKWTDAEDAIIDRATEMLREVDRRKQPSIEADYIRHLMGLTRQTYDPTGIRYLICTTASESLEIVANVLRLRRVALSLIEPCFDNVADIFERHWIHRQPFPDELLVAEDFEVRIEQVDSAAICLVSPNNPTGRMLDERRLKTLLAFCRRRNVLLIIDACFRAYVPDSQTYDQYALLRDSGVEFIVIEDTGKTWPTVELKVSVLAMSPGLYTEVFSIYSDFLLHVSPFTIRLLTEFVKLSIANGRSEIRNVVAQNRRALYRAISSTSLTPLEEHYCSVSWLATGGQHARELVERLERYGVFVLAGNRFYWSDPMKGQRFIRAALVRSPDVFMRACDRIAQAVAQDGTRSM